MRSKRNTPKMTFRSTPTSLLSCSTGNGNVKNRIRTVVEGHGELVFAEAIARHTIGFGQTLKGFVVDEPGLFVDVQIALAVGRTRLDVQDFTAPFHVDILAGRDVFQSIGRIGFSGDIPHAPQGAIFRAQSPE